ncbi:MAG: hypothetical protein EOO57_02680 [Hymenobacter sp.]|nr:MAG: hypothetical protein EOO57_02680 [Hymenobacter sp.]
MTLIPEIKLIPSPKAEEAKAAVGYKWNDVAGTRHKLGGKPIGENVDWPVCGECKKQMNCYATIDSIGDEYDLLDCSVIKVFVCLHCFTTCSQINQALT